MYVCLLNNKIQAATKSYYFDPQGQSQGHKFIDLGVF